MDDSNFPNAPRNLVGYGPHPPSVQWPSGARVAVQFVINYEEGAENTPLDFAGNAEVGLAEVNGGRMAPGERDLAFESMYEYGSRVGIWRLLSAFKARRVPVTLFACAVALEKNPALVEAIGIDGHDICCHGYRWEEHFRLSVEQEADRIARAVDTIRRLTGQPPVGWYCRYGPSPDTRRLVVENGSFLYDSDAYNDDLPYWTKVGDKNHLVIPYALDTNDLKFAPGNNFSTGSSFFEYLRDSFETLAEEGRHWPRMMSIGLHARLAGRPGRVGALHKFIDYAEASGCAWFCRRIDIAKHWITHHPSGEKQTGLKQP